MTDSVEGRDPPLLSIAIPTFRRPRLLRSAISSALEQKVDGLEVLVGDDSTEGEQVVAEVADPRVRYIQHPRRLGNPGNSTVLLDAARGAYLALLNDDDRLSPDFASRCLDVFAESPDIGVVFTNHYIEFPNSSYVRPCDLPAGRHDAFSYKYLEHQPVAASAAVFRREAWHDARPLPTDTRVGDLILFARMADAGWPFFYIDSPLMTYGEHADNISAELGHRKDVVVAWDAFTFSDPRAEALRQRRLADALVGRASVHLRELETDAATADLRRAAGIGSSSRARAALLRSLARHQTLARVAFALGTKLHWRPWTRHDPVTARVRRPPRHPSTQEGEAFRRA